MAVDGLIVTRKLRSKFVQLVALGGVVTDHPVLHPALLIALRAEGVIRVRIDVLLVAIQVVVAEGELLIRTQRIVSTGEAVQSVVPLRKRPGLAQNVNRGRDS